MNIGLLLLIIIGGSVGALSTLYIVAVSYTHLTLPTN